MTTKEAVVGTVAIQLGSTRVGTWFSALPRDDRKTVLVLLHDLRTASEKRVGAAETDQTRQFFTRQLDLVLGLLRALDDDHASLKLIRLTPGEQK